MPGQGESPQNEIGGTEQSESPEDQGRELLIEEKLNNLKKGDVFLEDDNQLRFEEKLIPNPDEPQKFSLQFRDSDDRITFLTKEEAMEIMRGMSEEDLAKVGVGPTERRIDEILAQAHLDKGEPGRIDLVKGPMNDETPGPASEEAPEPTPERPSEGEKAERPSEEAKAEEQPAAEAPERAEEARPSRVRLTGELRPEDEQYIKDRLQDKESSARENPYVYGAEKGAKYKKLDRREMEDFKNITDVYVYQKGELGETLDHKLPLARAIALYGDYQKENNFQTAHDTKNAIWALKAMRQEGVPEDMEKDIKDLERGMIDNLQRNERGFLGRLYSRFIPNARAEFAEEHELGEKVDPEELLKKGLEGREHEIVQGAAERAERPEEPEQTSPEQEQMNLANILLEPDALDPSKIDQTASQLLERGEGAGIDPAQLEALRQAVEEYSKDKNSEKMNKLLIALMILGILLSVAGEASRRRG